MTIDQLNQHLSAQVGEFCTIGTLAHMAEVSPGWKRIVYTKIYPVFFNAMKRVEDLKEFVALLTEEEQNPDAMRTLYKLVGDTQVGAGPLSVAAWWKKDAEPSLDVIGANLSYKGLSAFPWRAFQPSLTTLLLNENRITYLPPQIGRLVGLENLNLSYNQLTEIPDTLGNLSQLKELRLNHNKLTRLPATLSKLKKLTFFNVEQNPLQSVPTALKRAENSAIREHMWIRWANEEDSAPIPTPIDPRLDKAMDLITFFTGVAEGTMTSAAKFLTGLRGRVIGQADLVEHFLNRRGSELKKIKALDLVSFTFSDFPMEVFRLSQLQKLIMSHCGLTRLPDEIGGLSELTALYLRHNRLTRLPVSLNRLSKLTELYLTGNQITHVPKALKLSKIRAIRENDEIIAAEVEKPAPAVPPMKLLQTPLEVEPVPTPELSIWEQITEGLYSFCKCLELFFKQIVQYMRF